ncbi:Ig-like domain-containing protein [Flammeovirga kamogawensis]|uniref:T9SS type A sorting domain-containing protein n=1 Tax=Flammeovirga kamogawensis TaxID=373891 RepID=A0ABX8GVY2_9BACT|nr:Ig-like domain-containing protein [Flammeovirga kamogawensis]MBB6461582.1 hypothetical protein [Flammeovirga kamogawensis]QWG07487.1 T9SS type A sorting domain-containing protein [Flammeovirga kamogawensis]TRX69300.1 T9SS type A sorting domain-containing protein [Flammeovirga kamogawensis]
MIKLYYLKYIFALPLFLFSFCVQAQTLTHNNNISVNTTSLEWTLTGTSLSPVVTDFELFENATGQTAGTLLTLITINSGTEYRIIANISTLKTDTDQFKLQFNSTDATKNYIIDETAPSAPSLLRIHEDFDLGVSNTDNITNMTSLLFQVTAEVGSTITLYDGSNNLIATGPCTGTNVFIGIVTAITQNIQAYATDIAGNTSVVTVTPITVDTTPPSAPNTPDLLTSSDSGTNTSDNITNNTTPTFTLSGLTNTTGFKVQLESDKDGILETVLITASSQDVTVSTSLSEGVHQISAKMIDVAGNESIASGNLSLTIDISIPVTPSITLDTNSDTGRDNSDNNSNDLTPTFNVVSPVGSTITLYEGSNTKGTLLSTGLDQITSSTITSGAVYNFTVKVNDTAGNESAVSNTITYDVKNIVIPPLTLPTLAGGSDSGITGDGKTNDTTPTFNFPGLTNVDSREIIVNSSIDGEVGRESITGASRDITLSALSEGTHTISYFIEDVYGNNSTSGSQVLIIDTTPPSLSSVSIASDNGVNTELVANGNTSTLSFTSSEILHSTSSVTLGGQSTTLSNTGTDYTASYLFTNPANYIGVSFIISLVDEAGNVGTSVTATTDGSQNYFYPTLTNTISPPATTQFCNGDLVTFSTPSSGAVGGTGTYTYNWERRLGAGAYVSLNYSDEQLVENASLSTGIYTYRRSVESEGVTLNSNTFSISVIANINNIIASPVITEYCNSINTGGLSINATSTLGGTGTFSYQWQYAINGGGWINNGTSSNYSNSSILSTTGTYSFRRIVTSGACTSISNEVEIVINPSISLNTINNISGNTVCLGDAIVLIGSIPTGGDDSYTYQWYSQRNGGSFNSIPGATSQSYYNASVSNPGQYVFRREVTSGNCTSQVSTPMINVPGLITTFNLEPSTTSYSDIQSMAVPLNVTGLVSGETFYCTGPGVVSTGTGSGNNNFYPNLATQGTHTIYYHISGSDGCEQEEAVVFNIYDGSSVISVGAQYCEDDAAVTLTVPVTPSFTGTSPYTLVRFEGDGTSGVGTPSGATFTPSDVLAANPSVLDGQNYSTTLTAVYEDASIPAVEYSVSQSVIITKNHVASINLSQVDFCEDDAPFSVNANVDGALSTSGGVFDLDGGAIVSNNSIIINPRALTLGSHTLTYTYTDSNINSCSAVDVFTFNVNRLPTVGYRYTTSGDDGDFCFDGDTVFLQGIANSVDVTSGAFSTPDAIAAALVDNGDGTAYFIPSLMGLDIYDSDEDYTITFSYTDGVGCVNDADSIVTIYGFDEVGLAFSSSSDSICYSEGDVLITPMEGLTAYGGNGTYSINTGGLTSNMDGTASFDPSVAAIAAGETSTSDYSMHVITYTYDNLEGCLLSINDTLYVKPLPAIPTLTSSVPTYCSNDVALAPIQVTGEAGASFVWYSDPGLTSVVSSSNTLNPSNAPNVSVVTTVSYYVVQTNTDVCTSDPLQVDILIYPKPVAPLLHAANQTTYCSGEIVNSLSVATPGNNIKWYSDVALTTQVGFGDSFTPALNTNVSSDSSVTYYVTETTNGCEGPSTLLSIQIYKTPNPPTFNTPTVMCSGGALSSLTIAAGTNVKWYSDVAGTNYLASGNNYLPSFSTNVVNDSTVSYYATSTVNGCESATAVVNIIINALPDAPSVPDIAAYCEAETILPITASGETGATFKWYSDVGLTTLESVNQTFNPMRIAPTYLTLDTLNYWVIQVGTDGCESLPQKVDIPVYPTPSKPVIDNTNPIYCSGDVIQAINVTSGSNIKWYDDVALTSIVSTTTSFTPPDPNSASDFTQKYFVTQTINGCESDTTQVTFVVNKTPDNPSVTATLSYCSGDVLQPMIVTGLVDNITWYSDVSLSTIVATTNTFTPTNNTVVTAETTYTYYVTDTHLGCEGIATQLDIVVHPLPVFDLFGIDDGEVFCKSDENPLIITTVSGGVLTSPTGALIRTNSEVVLENSPLGAHTIRYTYTNENGCVDFIERSFTIVDVPIVTFDYDVFCDTRTVEFRDGSTLQDSTSIISWEYDFGVGESSVTLTDSVSAASYQHTFNTAGFKTVVLTVITNQGCSEISSTETIFIGTPPEVAFEWKVPEFGADMLFEETSQAIGIDTLSIWQWDFGDGTIEIIDALTNPTGATRHRYSQVGEYDVELMVTTTKGCSKVIMEKVYVLPRVSLISEDDEYFENFNSSNGDWVHRGDSSSWDYGIANGTDLITETNAWVTNLTSNYHFNEHSFLYTPSFDISGLSRPMITFDMQFDMETDVDGLTLQYSLDSGQTWDILGSVDDPINWYNSEDVSINPGNQLLLSGDNPIGWSGSTVEEGAIFREFKSIRHSLDQFIGQEHLQFRFAFRSNSALVHEGVVIDNIFIGNRKKVVVLESMTNAGQLSDARSLPRLDSVLNYLSEDAFAINYHIKLSGYSDSLNTDNPEPSSGRKFYYGITDAPNTIVDGNSFQGHTDDFINNYQNYIATRALLDPEFDISLQLPSVGGTDEIEVTITANTEFSADDTEIVVHLVTVEREIFGVEVSRGLSRHSDVMKSMSPAPGAEGTSFVGRSWVTGSTETFTVEWDNPQVYDTDQAEVIAFVQNNITKEIYQAIRLDVSTLTSSDPVLSINTTDIIDWEVYPNPSSDIVNISAPSSFINCSYIVSNTNGKKILEDRFTGNTYSIDVNTLPTGVYILQHFQGDEVIGQPLKFVVVK